MKIKWTKKGEKLGAHNSVSGNEFKLDKLAN